MPTFDRAPSKAQSRPKASPPRQSARTPGSLFSQVPEVVQQVLASPGQAPGDDTRRLLESRFGHDFGKVRVHADTLASDSARAVGARAYTVGNHVVFGAGQYQPGTRSGLHLLAHEMAHVVQQGGRPLGVQTRLEMTRPGDAAEREADRAADAVVRGRAATSLSPSPALLARWKIEGSTATVDSTEDRLGQLPPKVQSNALNWVGIKPIAMKTASYATPPARFSSP
jgi:hypothetical protein